MWGWGAGIGSRLDLRHHGGRGDPTTPHRLWGTGMVVQLHFPPSLAFPVYWHFPYFRDAPEGQRAWPGRLSCSQLPVGPLATPVPLGTSLKLSWASVSPSVKHAISQRGFAKDKKSQTCWKSTRNALYKIGFFFSTKEDTSLRSKYAHLLKRNDIQWNFYKTRNIVKVYTSPHLFLKEENLKLTSAWWV